MMPQSSVEQTSASGPSISSPGLVEHSDDYKEYVRKMDLVKDGNPLFRKPRYEDHPRVIDEDYKRASWEHGHYKQMRHDWLHPPPFPVPSTHLLTLREYHDCCWKNSVLYSTCELVGNSLDDLLNFIWHAWFRGDDTSIANDEFPCKHLECFSAESPKRIPAIIEAHRALCEQLWRREHGLDTMRPSGTDGPGDMHHRHADYKMLPSFGQVFLVVDTLLWYEQGIWLVRSDQTAGLDLDGIEGGASLPIFRKGDQGIAVCVKVEKAIAIIMGIQQSEEAKAVRSSVKALIVE